MASRSRARSGAPEAPRRAPRPRRRVASLRAPGPRAAPPRESRGESPALSVHARRPTLPTPSLATPPKKRMASSRAIVSGRRPLRAVCFSKRFAPHLPGLVAAVSVRLPPVARVESPRAETALPRPGKWGANRALKGTALSGLAAADGLERCDECPVPCTACGRFPGSARRGAGEIIEHDSRRESCSMI